VTGSYTLRTLNKSGHFDEKVIDLGCLGLPREKDNAILCCLNLELSY